MSETINFLVKQGEIIGEVSGGGGGESNSNFVGTRAEWEALTTAQQNAYDTVDIVGEDEGTLIAELTCDGTHDVAYYTNQLYSYVNQFNTDRLLKSSIVVFFSGGQFITRSPFEMKTPNGYLYAYIDNGAVQAGNTHIYGLKVASSISSWHYTQTTFTSTGNSITDKSSEVWASGTKIYLYA